MVSLLSLIREIGFDEKSSNSEADLEDGYSQTDVGLSENTRSSVVIIESDEEDNSSLFQINLCVFSKFVFLGFDGR